MFDALKKTYWVNDPSPDVVRAGVVEDAVGYLETNRHLNLDYLTSAEFRKVQLRWTPGEDGVAIHKYHRVHRPTD